MVIVSAFAGGARAPGGRTTRAKKRGGGGRADETDGDRLGLRGRRQRSGCGDQQRKKDVLARHAHQTAHCLHCVAKYRAISAPVAFHTPSCRQMWASAASKASMRWGTPVR